MTQEDDRRLGGTFTDFNGDQWTVADSPDIIFGLGCVLNVFWFVGQSKVVIAYQNRIKALIWISIIHQFGIGVWSLVLIRLKSSSIGIHMMEFKLVKTSLKLKKFKVSSEGQIRWLEIPFSDLCEIYGPCPTHYICQHAPFYAKDAIECVCDPNNPNPMDPNCVRKFLRKHQSKRHHASNIYSNIILVI